MAAATALTIAATVLRLVLFPLPATAGPVSAAAPAVPPAAVTPAAAIVPVGADGPTIVSQNISQDTVWGPKGSPYVILDQTIVVRARLTLLPGTVVKLNGATSEILVLGGGQLLALGSPRQRVIITSYKDDAVAGDTNGDGSASTPAAEDWGSVDLSTGSATTNVLDYATIRYGGWGSANCNYPEVSVDSGARVIVSNSEFTDTTLGISNSSLSPYTGFVGLYNSTFVRTRCGAAFWKDSKVEVIGNTFDSTSMLNFWDAKNGRVAFNVLGAGIDTGTYSLASVVDIQYNHIAGRYKGNGTYSRNWWGIDANVLPQCIDATVASSYNPPIKTTTDRVTCPGTNQLKVVGYSGLVLPALSASPEVLPTALRESNAPRVGSVNAYSGALTYAVEDMLVEDAGKTLSASRTYRSDKTAGSDAGPGWFTAYSEGVSSTSGLATVSLGDGQTLDFRTDAAAGYARAPGVNTGYSADTTGTTVTTPNQTGYQFDAAGELQTITLGDPGHKVTVKRENGKPSRVTGVSGRYLDYSRDGGLVRAISDSTGRGVALAYANGRLSAVTGVDGKAETYTYDDNGRLTRVTTPMGRVKLAAGYDNAGRVAWVEELGQGRSTFEYDTAMGRTVVTRADGTRSVHEYDWAGRLVVDRVEQGSGPEFGAVGGSSGRHVVYDGEGHVVADVRGVPTTPMTGYAPQASVTIYDGKGDPILTEPAGLGPTQSTFDSAHRPLVSTRFVTSSTTSVTMKSYTTEGRLASVKDPLGKTWTYTYNGRGQLTKRVDPLNRPMSVTYADNGDRTSITDETGATTQFEYDNQGRISAVIDALNNRREFTYAAWGAIASTKRATGGVTTVEFNDDRQPVMSKDAVDATTRIEYDSAGRVSTTIDAGNGRTVVAYDVMGRRSTVTDASSSVTTWAYGSEGWPITVTDPVGAVTATVYDPTGRPIRVTDALGQVTQTVYLASSKVWKHQTPDGATRTYGYDLGGRLITYTTARGYVWNYTYDLADRSTSVKDPVPYTQATSYDDLGRVASTTDQAGTVTTYSYNDEDRSTTATDPLGTVGTESRDAAGRLKTRTDSGGAATIFKYNADGLPTSEILPGGTTTRYEYDLAGRQTATVDAAGRRTVLTLNSLGHMTARDNPGGSRETFEYDAAGKLTHHVDANQNEWIYAYDAAHRLTRSTDPLGKSAVYVSDSLGRVTSETDASGVVRTTGYDPVGRVAVEADTTGASWLTKYNLDGDIASKADPAGITWSFAYNSRGLLTEAAWGTQPVRFSFGYNAVGRQTSNGYPYPKTYEYDIRWRLKAEVDALGKRTVFTYDDAGRQTSETAPSGNMRSWTYDAAGLLETATDGVGNTSRYSYDDANQLTRITLPRGGHYDYEYGADGRMSTETDPVGGSTAFTYDGNGQIVKTTYPSGREVTVAYDAAGHMASTSAGAETRTFGYDDAGRLTSANSAAGTYAYTYDNRGLLINSRDGLGDTAFEYDVAQRLTRRAPAVGVASTFTYDAARGLLATVRGPTNVNLTYNNAGQVLKWSWVSPSKANAETVQYDSNGRMTSRASTWGTQTATYNSDGLIASLNQTVSGNSASNVTAFEYDGAARLITAQLSRSSTVISTTNYGWDEDSNRTSITVDGGIPVTATYDLADRLIATSAGVGHTYDDDGNLKAVDRVNGTNSYTYNGFGELTGATTPSGAVGYTRDPFSRVGARSSGGVNQTYSYAGTDTQPSVVRTGAQLAQLARDPHGLLLAVAPVGSTALRAYRTIHGDLARLDNDSTSTTTWSAIYDPFGNSSTVGTAPPVSVGFQSMLSDPVTGLVDMGFRSYDPTSGGFTAPDSVIGDLRNPTSLNRYLYANANPVNMYDPDGHWPGWLDSAVDWAGDQLASVGDAVEEGVDAAAEWTSNRLAEADEWAQQTRDSVTTWIDEHQDQIRSTVAGIAAGALVIAGCAALGVATAGIGAIACATAAGALAGGVTGGMNCQGPSTYDCVANGALVGGVAGLAGGFAAAAGGGFFTVGALSAFAGDATDQLSSTGTIDPTRLGAATLTGGALGWAGGKLFSGKRTGRADERDTSPACLSSGHSFDPKTPVLMADGSTKPIDQVEIGDEVAATDSESGTTSGRAVTAVHVNVDTDLTDVSIQTAAGIAVLHTTANHLFWDDTERRWVPASELKPGHSLRTDAGQSATVTKVSEFSASKQMRDLTISDFHTYYVLAGQTPVLVHNCGETMDFAHGTTSRHADSIEANGLSGDAARANTHRGSVSQPGSLFTYKVTPEDSDALSAAASFGGSRTGPGERPSLLVFQTCKCVYDRLTAAGEITTRVTDEVTGRIEHIFSPKAMSSLELIFRRDF